MHFCKKVYEDKFRPLFNYLNKDTILGNINLNRSFTGFNTEEIIYNGY